MIPETILVTAAMGKTGRLVVHLPSAGVTVGPGSRSTLILFDWNDDSAWSAALEGVTGIYVMTNDLRDPDTVEVFRSFAQLAVHSGARRAVMASIPDTGNDAESASSCTPSSVNSVTPV